MRTKVLDARCRGLGGHVGYLLLVLLIIPSQLSNEVEWACGNLPLAPLHSRVAVPDGTPCGNRAVRNRRVPPSRESYRDRRLVPLGINICLAIQWQGRSLIGFPADLNTTAEGARARVSTPASPPSPPRAERKERAACIELFGWACWRWQSPSL